MTRSILTGILVLIASCASGLAQDLTIRVPVPQDGRALLLFSAGRGPALTLPGVGGSFRLDSGSLVVVEGAARNALGFSNTVLPSLAALPPDLVHMQPLVLSPQRATFGQVSRPIEELVRDRASTNSNPVTFRQQFTVPSADRLIERQSPIDHWTVTSATVDAGRRYAVLDFHTDTDMDRFKLSLHRKIGVWVKIDTSQAFNPSPDDEGRVRVDDLAPGTKYKLKIRIRWLPWLPYFIVREKTFWTEE